LVGIIEEDISAEPVDMLARRHLTVHQHNKVMNSVSRLRMDETECMMSLK